MVPLTTISATPVGAPETEPEQRLFPHEPETLDAPAASSRRGAVIALVAVAGILVHLLLRWWDLGTIGTAATGSVAVRDLPLLAVLLFGGLPLVIELAAK